MEVGDDRYTRRFGRSEVQDIDTLDVNPTNEKAALIGDLQDLSNVEDGSYDCVIVTHVLQYLQDPSAESASFGASWVLEAQHSSLCRPRHGWITWTMTCRGSCRPVLGTCSLRISMR